MSSTLFVFLQLLIIQVYIEAADIPSFLHICRRYDPHLSRCLTTSVEGLTPFLATGVQEYNVPSMEPLILDDFTSATVGINFTSTDVKAYGCSEFFVRRMKADIDNQVFDMELEVPRIRILSNYTLQGQFLMIPINGSAEMTVDVRNCKVNVKLKGELHRKNEHKHLKFVRCETRIKFGKGFVDLGDIFGRDTLTNKVLNEVSNRNFDDFAAELIPMVQDSLSLSVLNISNAIVENFTFKQLFPY